MSLLALLLLFVIFLYFEISLSYFLVLLIFPFAYIVVELREFIHDVRADREYYKKMKEFNKYYHNKE